MFSYRQSGHPRRDGQPGPGEPPRACSRSTGTSCARPGWYALMFVTSLAVALIDTAIPVFIGKLVSLMEALDRQAALRLSGRCSPVWWAWFCWCGRW